MRRGPPQWQLYEVGGNVRYQDDDLVMVSLNRPLPGVRLERKSRYPTKRVSEN